MTAITEPAGRRDETYYWADNVTFEVEETLFRVSPYPFILGSEYFVEKYGLLSDEHRSGAEGVVHLEGATAAQFRVLLKFLFPVHITSTTSTFTKEEWLNILTLSTLWHFHDARKLAIQHLDGQLTDLELILVGRAAYVPRWVLAGYRAVVERPKLYTLTEDIGDAIGHREVNRLWAIRYHCAVLAYDDSFVGDVLREKFKEELAELAARELERRTKAEVERDERDTEQRALCEAEAREAEADKWGLGASEDVRCLSLPSTATPLAESTVTEEQKEVATKLLAGYRRMVRIREMKKVKTRTQTSCDSFFATCLQRSEEMEWGRCTLYKKLYLGLVPHLLACVDVVKSYSHARKREVRKQLLDKLVDLDALSKEIDALKVIFKSSKRLCQRLEPSSELHNDRDVQQLKPLVGEVEELLGRLPPDHDLDIQFDLGLAVKGIVQTKRTTEEHQHEASKGDRSDAKVVAPVPQPATTDTHGYAHVVKVKEHEAKESKMDHDFKAKLSPELIKVDITLEPLRSVGNKLESQDGESEPSGKQDAAGEVALVAQVDPPLEVIDGDDIDMQRSARRAARNKAMKACRAAEDDAAVKCKAEEVEKKRCEEVNMVEEEIRNTLEEVEHAGEHWQQEEEVEKAKDAEDNKPLTPLGPLFQNYGRPASPVRGSSWDSSDRSSSTTAKMAVPRGNLSPQLSLAVPQRPYSRERLANGRPISTFSNNRIQRKTDGKTSEQGFGSFVKGWL